MSTKKVLIVNADDYGHTPGITYAIIEAHRNGIVSSTTALTVSDYFEDAMKLLPMVPNLKLGVHLTLTLRGAHPLLGDDVPSLTDENGNFWSGQEVVSRVNLEEVEREWDAQIQKFYATGHTPTHLDSHHNVHGFSQGLFDVALRLAKKYDLPLRNYIVPEVNDGAYVHFDGVKTTPRCFEDFYGPGVKFETIESIVDQITKIDDTIFEMNCHPGFTDHILPNISSYVTPRVVEVGILTSEKAKELLEKNNIVLGGFDQI